MKHAWIFVMLGLWIVPPLVQADDESLPALVQVLGTSDDPQFHLDILKGMSEGLKGRRNVKMPAGWDELATKLAQSTNAQVREIAQALSVTFGSTTAFAALRKTLADAQAQPGARLAALDSLLGAHDPALPSLLQPLLNDPAVRGGALRGLAAYDDDKSPAAIAALYPSFPAPDKRDALNTLVSRKSFARVLLASVAAGKIPARDLTAELVRQLRNFRDEKINAEVAKLWGTVRETDADRAKEIARYKTMITGHRPGDAPKGRALFARTCQQCHTLFDTGGKVGPDITGSNRGDLDYVLQNVLDPNAVVPNDYRTSLVETKDDRILTGIVTRQDETALTIVTANETVLLPRAEISSVTQGELSMMPEGLIQALSDDEVCDLIAYLKSPAQVALPANGERR